MVYTQRETATMRVALEAGAGAANGLGMLLHQGVKSLEIWTGQTPPVEVMRRALEQHIYAEPD
jgi:shikimate dehydrogenase